MILDRQRAVLFVIDFQEKLLPRVQDHESVSERAIKLIEFCRALDIPIVWSEQYKKGLGETVDPFREALAGVTPHEKLSFGCLGDEGCSRHLADTGRDQLLLTGVETHICVAQTALQAAKSGKEVFVARDAVGAQRAADHEAGIERLEKAGADIVTAQMAMFEILGQAGTDDFKKVMPLLK